MRTEPIESLDEIIHTPLSMDNKVCLYGFSQKINNRKRMSGYAKIKAICLQCGTSVENQVTSQCINGHDEWITKNANWRKQQIAEMRFQMNWTDIVQKMKNKESLNRVQQ